MKTHHLCVNITDLDDLYDLSKAFGMSFDDFIEHKAYNKKRAMVVLYVTADGQFTGHFVKKG